MPGSSNGNAESGRSLAFAVTCEDLYQSHHLKTPKAYQAPWGRVKDRPAPADLSQITLLMQARGATIIKRCKCSTFIRGM
jgi:hypothetical protein